MNQPHPDGRPRVDETQAVGLLASRYGLAGTVESLPSYSDQNFRVQTDSGERFVLKIANARESEPLLECQNLVLRRAMGCR